MNATGRVKRPTTIRVPPTTSRSPPIPICESNSIGGMGVGLGGKPNFIVPLVTKIRPATMRKMASIRSGHG
jgi:hypothetical protein